MAAQASFEDSNIALLSSKLNHDLKLDAAHHEPAWNGNDKWGAGIKVWRIEQFKVHAWPDQQKGTFFSGDSFIVLHSYKNPESKSEELNHALYFWLGKDSTQDEQGTAAYKTVELDDCLGGKAVQSREVQGSESDGFKKVFPHLIYMDGGCESGFHHVGPANYKPRLLAIEGGRHPSCADVPLAAGSLHCSGVYILDNGLSLFQWNGSKSTIAEKQLGHKIIDNLKESRDFKPKSQILDGLEDNNDFWSLLGGKPSAEPSGALPAKPEVKDHKDHKKTLLKLSDRGVTKELKCEKVAEGKDLKKAMLTSDDVYIVDAGYQVFVWVGKNADKVEKAQAILYATKYLVDSELPATTPVTRIVEGTDCNEFNQVF